MNENVSLIRITCGTLSYVINHFRIHECHTQQTCIMLICGHWGIFVSLNKYIFFIHGKLVKKHQTLILDGTLYQKWFPGRQF